MGMPREELHAFLLKAFPDAIIDIKELAGDGDHYVTTIISHAFAGKNRLEQHKMVYDALEGHMGSRLHALSIKTRIPEENPHG